MVATPETLEIVQQQIDDREPPSRRIEAWFRSACRYHAQGHLPEAEAYYRQILAVQPESAIVYNNLGYCLHQQGRFDEAIAAYETALQLQPGFREAEANLGNTLQAQGRLTGEQQNQYSQLNLELGRERLRSQALQDAIAYCRQAIALQPEDWNSHYQLGLTLQATGQLDDAIDCYETVLRLQPGCGNAYLQLGKIYQTQKRFAQAIVAYRQGLQLINPHYAAAIASTPVGGDDRRIPVTPPVEHTTVTVGNTVFPALLPVSDSGKPRPFWSVVIPVYNRTDYLLECLASVLAQWTGKEAMEIIVIDDASAVSPILLELVRGIGGGIVTYYRNTESLGLPGNWNAGLALSRGQWIHLLHDDDYTFPGFYDRLYQSLQGYPQQVGAAFTGYENIDDFGKVVFSQTGYSNSRGIVRDFINQVGVCNPLNMPAVVIRRQVHEKLGVYHPELTYTSDWELYKRIAVYYDWWCELDILACYRQHSQSKTHEMMLSGTQVNSIRRAIEISKGYLPPQQRLEITEKSRIYYFEQCLRAAMIPLKTHNLTATWHLLQETIKIDQSPAALSQLFNWLAGETAVELREDIVHRFVHLALDAVDWRDSGDRPNTPDKIADMSATTAATDTLTQSPPNSDALYRLGILAQRMGRLQEAEKCWQKLIPHPPGSVQAWFSLGNLHQTHGNLSEAEAAYRQAIALQPNAAPIHNNLGYTLQQQGRLEEAIAHYQTALELQPNCLEAEANLGNGLFLQARLSAEQQSYYAALNYRLGKKYQGAGAFQLAVVYYQKSLELEPGNWDAYNSLGQIYQAQNDWAEAIAIYRQGLCRLNPHYANAVAAHQASGASPQATVTPVLPQATVTVGTYQFPAIPPVADPEHPRPFWTVVIPVYNRGTYLLECLASVLVQWPGADEMEILVMDNASTTPLLDLIYSLAGGIIRYYRHPQNIGAVANYNAGIAFSRGQWVHVLHDDDCVLPGFYASLQKSLINCPASVGVACTGFVYINEKGEAIETGELLSLYGEQRGILQQWLPKIGVCGLVTIPAMVVRRSTHEHLGGYFPELPEICDWEIFKRFASFYDWWYEPGVLACYREHTQKMTPENWCSGRMAKALRRAIEVSETYLPLEQRAEITIKARQQNFNYCLNRAILPLKAGNLWGTLQILQEALKIDASKQAITQLFLWFTQDETASLRSRMIALFTHDLTL